MSGRALRIAHLNTERTWRGGENQVFSLIKGLSEKFGHYNLGVVRSHGALSEKLKASSFPVYEVRPFGEWDFIAAHFLNRKLKREKIDVVHAHTSHATALAAFSTLGTSIPVVVTRRVDFHLSKNIFSRWKYKRATKIIAISKRVREILLEDGIPEKKLTLVPSGVDFSRFPSVGKATCSQMGVPNNAIVVGQVAAFAPHKDQATFLKAIALLLYKHPKVHVVMIGEGKLRKELEDLVKWLKIESSVHFLGFQKDPLLWIAGFDVFCLSSREEGLGTSILDAMALRIPVVATNAGGIPEMIEDGVTGYLAEVGNPESLANSLSKAIQGRDQSRELTDQAFSKAQHFDIQNTITQTEAVYRSLV